MYGVKSNGDNRRNLPMSWTSGNSGRRSRPPRPSAASLSKSVDPVVSSCRCGENRSHYRITESNPQGGNGVAAGTTINIYYDSQWQAIETRTGGTASSNVSSQTVWSVSYVNAAVPQDTYSGGVIQPNSRLYFEQDANWDTTAVVNLVAGYCRCRTHSNPTEFLLNAVL